MLCTREIAALKEQGWIRLPKYFGSESLEKLTRYMEDSTVHYTEENIKTRATYVSDCTEGRISNAYMVSTGSSPLPTIDISEPRVSSLVDDFHFIVNQMSGGDDFEIVHNTRSMLNMQTYNGVSKEVPWHFDGEYFRSYPGTTKIMEGLIPQWVAVCTINNRTEKGTLLKDNETGEILRPPSVTGDMIIFNNTKFLHGVESIGGERSIIGLRNFDYNPWYYHSCTDGELIQNQCFNGRREKVSTKEAEARMDSFNRKFADDYEHFGVEAAKF
jgi:hypothetical protein